MGGLLGGDLGSHETDLYTPDERMPMPKSPAEQDANLTMMRQKAAEAKRPYESGEHGAGVYDSIKKHGFQGHISLDTGFDRPKVWEGHHRIAAGTLAEQSGLGNQFIGLDYIDPTGKHGTPERLKPMDYQKRYPQNVGDSKWSSGATIDKRQAEQRHPRRSLTERPILAP
jgi:hypothetical protein